jgi:hypothetical protein
VLDIDVPGATVDTVVVADVLSPALVVDAEGWIVVVASGIAVDGEVHFLSIPHTHPSLQSSHGEEHGPPAALFRTHFFVPLTDSHDRPVLQTR